VPLSKTYIIPFGQIVKAYSELQLCLFEQKEHILVLGLSYSRYIYIYMGVSKAERRSFGDQNMQGKEIKEDVQADACK
jgi:hypothetical protein